MLRSADAICLDILAIPLDGFDLDDRRRLTRAQTVAQLNRAGLRSMGDRTPAQALHSIIGYRDDLLLFPHLAPYVGHIADHMEELAQELLEVSRGRHARR